MTSFVTFFSFFLCILGIGLYGQECDVIVFSRDRPMQLFAFLESFDKHVRHARKVAVLCKISPTFEKGYEIIQKTFPSISFIRQSEAAENDFKPLLQELAFGSFGRGADFIAFAVDDIIFTDSVDFKEGIAKLQKTQAFGLYYRLGKNICSCLMQNFSHEIPVLQDVGNGYFTWDIKTGKGDWGYPNTVDLTLYRKTEIEKDICSVSFQGPNQLEGHWAANANKTGLCCEHSKVVNVILNTVSGYSHRGHRLTSADRLNQLFLDGFKIDIEPFHHLHNLSPHILHLVEFIPR